MYDLNQAGNSHGAAALQRAALAGHPAEAQKPITDVMLDQLDQMTEYADRIRAMLQQTVDRLFGPGPQCSGAGNRTDPSGVSVADRIERRCEGMSEVLGDIDRLSRVLARL